MKLKLVKTKINYAKGSLERVYVEGESGIRKGLITDEWASVVFS